MRYWLFSAKNVHDAAPARRSLVEYLEQDDISGERLFAIELILGELLGNVVRHAPGPVEIEFTWSGGTLPQLLVRYEGAGFDALPASTGPLCDEPGGRGLRIVQELATHLRLRRTPHNGMSVIATLPAV